jgi:hypothetical protein
VIAASRLVPEHRERVRPDTALVLVPSSFSASRRRPIHTLAYCSNVGSLAASGMATRLDELVASSTTEDGTGMAGKDHD